MANWTRVTQEPLTTESYLAVRNCDTDEVGSISVRWLDQSPEIYGSVYSTERTYEGDCCVGEKHTVVDSTPVII